MASVSKGKGACGTDLRQRPNYVRSAGERRRPPARSPSTPPSTRPLKDRIQEEDELDKEALSLLERMRDLA